MNKELLEILKKYIELLAKEVNNKTAYLYIRGIRTSEEKIKIGKKLRNKMRKFQELKDWNYLKGRD